MYNKLFDVLNGKEDNYMLPFYWQKGTHHETIPAEVERIYNSGCRAFCVESRTHEDFLGEGWWKDMDLILSEAKKRDMQVWILDDDHFPTGHAAGHIEKYYPEKARWDIAERHVDVMGPCDKSVIMTMENAETKLLGVYAYKRNGMGEELADEVIDFSKNVKNGLCEVTLPDGMWRVFFLYKTRELKKLTKFYIDMLSRDSVKVLIDAVYQPHYEHYKEYFGNTIKGFFSDEPGFMNFWFRCNRNEPGAYDYRLGRRQLAYPWNADVIKDMEAHLGYSPLPYMPALWFEVGEKTAELRYAYMDAITRFYRDNFTRQIGDWCSAHGVEYIGHIIEDMNAHKRTGVSAGHYFRAIDGQHMGGVDVIASQIVPGMCDYNHTSGTSRDCVDVEFFHYVLNKLGSSIAHIGKDMKGRAMCEMYGAYGWALGCSDMKWILDHLLVRGINYFVPHAFSPTYPNPDCPPHFGGDGTNDPQLEGFAELMKYGNKAAHLLCGGVHISDAAILYDAELEWMDENHSVRYMQTPAKLLYDENIDFDFLPIDCIVGAEDARLYPAKACNGKLKVGENTYGALIVPKTALIPGSLAKKLEELKTAGVPVIEVGEDFGHDSLIPTLRSVFTADVEAEGKKKALRSCHYKDGDNDIYMFVNESITEKTDCRVKLNRVSCESGVCLDILNGEIYGVTLKDKTMHLELSPYQSCILVFGDIGDESFPQKKIWEKRQKAELDFKIEIADAEDMQNFRLLEERVSADKLFSITAIDRIPDFSGRIRYTATFDSSSLPECENIALDLVNAGVTARLFLNGEDMGIKIAKPYVFDLSKKIREGENTFVIEVSNTLGNKHKDRFSGVMSMTAAGLTKQPYFLFS